MLGIMSSPSSNNGDNDAWLRKIDLKREEPTRVNKYERIKKTTEDQTKKNSKDRSCDGDTISGHLPQAWQLPRGVPIPM